MLNKIEVFIDLCKKNEILFSDFPLGEKQLKVFWMIFFEEPLYEIGLIALKDYLIENKLNIFINKFTFVRIKMNIFIFYCQFKNIKFHRFSIKGEDDFINTWYEYFEETIKNTQADYYMKFFGDKAKEIWANVDSITEEEYCKVANYCLEYDIFIDRHQLECEREIIDIWYLLFKKLVSIYNPYVENKINYTPCYDENKDSYVYSRVDMYKFKLIYNELKQKLINHKIEIFKYYKENNLDITDENKVNIFQKYWFELFYEKITFKNAQSTLNSIIKGNTLNSEERLLLYEYMVKNNIKFELNNKNNVLHLKSILKDLFKIKRSKNQLENILSDMYKFFPELISKKSIINKDIEFSDILNYFNSNNLYLSQNNNNAIIQVNNIYKDLYHTEADEDKILNIIKYLRDYFNKASNKNSKIILFPKLTDLERIKDEELQHLLILFSEFCKKEEIFFSRNENEQYLNTVWNRCFEIE
ncbi:hypothetical protein L5F32_03740 [Aliarcobacter butzleri]|uniref:hypothetical protein n=1 Tax=Aliarcobacter butzleri TaxID=28197 RepID=UPI001EDBB772|nr:hypothetical protein [Aliarcobacter butzleri]MCG3651380.1 hypothetical protein [Aliarcobacter butzleri]